MLVEPLPHRRAMRGRLAIKEGDNRIPLYDHCLGTHTEIPVCVVITSNDGYTFQNAGIFLDVSRMTLFQMDNFVCNLAPRLNVPVDAMWLALYGGEIQIDERDTKVTFVKPDIVLSHQWPPKNPVDTSEKYLNWQYYQES